MKPLLACDYNESKLVFPLGVQAKIDGVRGLTTEGGLTGRSLKKHKNIYTTKLYSTDDYANLDGELAADIETHPDLCRITSSAVGTIEGSPFTLWHVFDALNKHVINAPYTARHAWLVDYIASEQRRGNCAHARVIPLKIANNLIELNTMHSAHMDLGYEGTIIRNINGMHKEGRSTVNQGLLLRIKDFVEAEAIVVSVTEGNENENEAQTNKLGQTFRSSHQENKVPNGMTGSFECHLLEDVFDVHTDKLLLVRGQDITVSPGKMTHDMRKWYFENQNAIIGKTIKFKFFPKGIKDKPRFPTFVCLRNEEDISK